ncbi:MAG: TerB family tellurite resistance protein [Deltaproteobacteria bacterium]|nr:TerB family tellurite resistance protein [Deltaproteobacteria bacterium]
MIHILRKLFDKGPDKQQKPAHNLQGTQELQLATCALFLEMARIDGEFSESEREHIIDTMKKVYQLSDREVQGLMEAAEQQLDDSIDLWQFTNTINQSLSLEEKKGIIETMWQVVYADEYLEKHEDYLMHKLANLLRLSHKQLIEAKLKAKGKKEPWNA